MCLSLSVLLIQFRLHCFRKKVHSQDVSEPDCSSFTYKNDAPWFTVLCHEKRFYFYQMFNKYRENKTNTNRVNMVKARSEYKTTLRKARYDYDKKKTMRLENARFKNAKLYWNLLKVQMTKFYISVSSSQL